MPPNIPALPKLPALIARDQRIVDRGFWKKLLKLAGQLPFAEDLAAAFFCATDSATPTRAKGLLLAALAYFVTPVDVIPDFVAGLGFTDDAAVLAAAIALVAQHLKPEHREKARSALQISPEQK